MKKIIISSLFVAFALFAFAVFTQSNVLAQTQKTNNNVKWMTFEQAVAAIDKDKKEGRKPKKIFIDIYTDWCGWCKKMDKETFEHPDIAPYLNKNFYPVKLNAEQREDIKFANHTFKFVPQGARGYHELAASLLDGQMSYPTVIFLNEDVQMLQRIPGYLDIPTFDCIMHYLAEEHFRTTPWADYQRQFAQAKKGGK
jgi:thioredoxin-related protein